jgi:hypothetical protein
LAEKKSVFSSLGIKLGKRDVVPPDHFNYFKLKENIEMRKLERKQVGEKLNEELRRLQPFKVGS